MGITDPSEEHFKDGVWGWDSDAGTWIKCTASDGKLQVETVPEAHAATHQDGGDDEISVAALSGTLADAQTPANHVLGGTRHIADTLADLNTKISDAILDTNTASRTPLTHQTTHTVGGSDKIKFTRQILWYLPDATLATGSDKSATIVYRGPTLTLLRWDFHCKTAPTGATLIADIHLDGTSLWDTTQANRPTIAISGTSATGTAFDTTSIADSNVLKLDIDQIGSTIAGGYATLILEGDANPEPD